MATDALFYEHARQFPESGPTLATGARPRGRIEAMSLTLKRSERRIDVVLRPLARAILWWVFEYLDYRSPQAERKLVARAIALADEWNLWGRIHVVLVCTRRTYADALLPARLGPRGEEGLRPVRVVLEDLDADALRRLGPEFFPFLPFVGIPKDSIRDHARSWSAEIAADPRMSAHVRHIFEAFLKFYASRFPRDSIEETKKLLEVNMRFEETTLARVLVRKGEERGEKRGEKRGAERGSRETLLRTIQDVLKIRFGSAPVRLLRRIEALSTLGRLHAAHRLAVRADDLGEFREGLTRIESEASRSR